MEGRRFVSWPGQTRDHHKNGTNCLPVLKVMENENLRGMVTLLDSISVTYAQSKSMCIKQEDFTNESGTVVHDLLKNIMFSMEQTLSRNI